MTDHKFLISGVWLIAAIYWMFKGNEIQAQTGIICSAIWATA